MLARLPCIAKSLTYAEGISGSSVEVWANVLLVSAGLWAVKKLVHDMLLPGGAFGIKPEDCPPNDNPDNCAWNEAMLIFAFVSVADGGGNAVLATFFWAVVDVFVMLSLLWFDLTLLGRFDSSLFKAAVW